MSLHSDVQELVSAASFGVYAYEDLPSKKEPPFCIFRVLNEDPLTTISTETVSTNYDVAFECYHKNLAGSLAMVNEIRALINSSDLLFLPGRYTWGGL